MSGSKKEQVQREYAAQFFGFIPSDIVDVVNEDCRDLITSSLQAIKMQIEKKQRGKVDSEELGGCMESLEKRYHGATEKIFEKTTRYLCANMLRVPPHVLLQEDQAWESEESPDAVMAALGSTRGELAALGVRIENGKYKREVLLRNLQQLEAVAKYQEEALALDAKLFREHKVDSFEDTSKFCAAQIKNQDGQKEELQKVVLDSAGGDTKDLRKPLFSEAKRKKVEQNTQDYLASIENMQDYMASIEES